MVFFLIQSDYNYYKVTKLLNLNLPFKSYNMVYNLDFVNHFATFNKEFCVVEEGIVKKTQYGIYPKYDNRLATEKLKEVYVFQFYQNGLSSEKQKVIKLKDGLYYAYGINCSNYVLNDRLEKTNIDYKVSSIIEEIAFICEKKIGNETLYGAVDFNNKIIIPFNFNEYILVQKKTVFRSDEKEKFVEYGYIDIDIEKDSLIKFYEYPFLIKQTYYPFFVSNNENKRYPTCKIPYNKWYDDYIEHTFSLVDFSLISIKEHHYSEEERKRRSPDIKVQKSLSFNTGSGFDYKSLYREHYEFNECVFFSDENYKYKELYEKMRLFMTNNKINSFTEVELKLLKDNQNDSTKVQNLLNNNKNHHERM